MGSMGIELFFIAVGLSMDAFAVSICKGLAAQQSCRTVSVITGLWFGGFQALMPFLGYLCGGRISRYITSISKYLALAVLSVIGINMIREAISEKESDVDASLNPRIMFPLSVVTSIDAFAVGITLAALQVRIVPAVSLIGCTTFFISFVGVHIGSIFGNKFKKHAAFLGGIILICIGLRIFISGS